MSFFSGTLGQNSLVASQVLAQINTAIQSWASSPTSGTAANLADRLDEHLTALDELMPNQASQLRLALANEGADPASIVAIAARIAQAADVLRQIDAGEYHGGNGSNGKGSNGNGNGIHALGSNGSSRRMTTRATVGPPTVRSLVPVSIPPLPSPTSVDIALPNMARMTGGLLATLPMTFAEWLDHEDAALAGHGEIKQAGIIFTDFKGFSTRTKGVPPDQVRRRLNFYFHFLSLTVAQLGGQVDKYIGDALMAYVIDHPNNSLRAVEIAHSLQQVVSLMTEFLIDRAKQSDKMREKLAALGKTFQELDSETQQRLIDEVDPLIFPMRVGVHTGPVIHGEIGGPGKLEITIIGDAVNTANRMESASDPGGVCISDAVRADLGGEFSLSQPKSAYAKGIGQLDVYQVLGRNHEKGLRLQGQVHTTVQGRTKEVDFLEREFLQSATASKSHLVIIEAEAGAGKSTVADTFIQRLKQLVPADLHGFDLIIGRGDFRPEMSPFDILAEALRRRSTINPGMSKTEREGKIRMLAASADTDSDQQRESFAHLLGLFIDDPLENPPENVLNLQKNPADFRAAMEAMLLKLFSGLSRRMPLLLVFDDMQWIDDSSLKFLHRVLSELKSSPITMIGLSRPLDGEQGERAKAHNIAWFDGPYTASAMELRRLTSDDLEKIVREILGGGATDETVAAILARSEGSPLFAQETAFAIKNGKSIDQVPTTIQELFQSQLKDLEIGPFVALKAAALVGREFTEDDLIGTGIAQPRLFLPTLAKANFILSKEGAEGTYVFRHDRMLETVRGMMEEGEKALLHLAYARHLSEAKNADDAIIASHFQRGGDAENAARHFTLAAREASQKGAYREAAAFARSAFEATRDPDKRVASLIDWSDALFYSENQEAQLALFPLFDNALQYLGTSDRESSMRIRIHRAQALQKNKRHEEAEQELNQALALYGTDEGSPFKCRVLNLLGNIHSQNKHDHARAEAYYREALGTAQRLGDLYYTGMSFVNLSHIRLTQGDYSGGLQAALNGIQAFEAAGDMKGQLFAINNAGSALVSVGEYEEGMKMYERGIELSRSKMNNFLLLSLLPSYAQPAWKSGARTKAMKAIQSAIALFGQNQSSYSFMRGVAHYCHSIFSTELGDVETALSEAKETLAISQKTNDRSKNIEAMAHLAMARAYMKMGQLDAARSESTAAVEIFKKLGSIQDYDLAILSTHISVLTQSKADKEALVVADQAKRLLDARAGSIADEKHRLSFLTRVEDNHEIERSWQVLKAINDTLLDAPAQAILKDLDYYPSREVPSELRYISTGSLGVINRRVEKDKAAGGVLVDRPLAKVLATLLSKGVTVPKNTGEVRGVWAEDIQWVPFFDVSGKLHVHLQWKLAASASLHKIIFPLIRQPARYQIILRDRVYSKDGVVYIELEPTAERRLVSSTGLTYEVQDKMEVEDGRFGAIRFVLAPTADDKTLLSFEMDTKQWTQNPWVLLEQFLPHINRS